MIDWRAKVTSEDLRDPPMAIARIQGSSATSDVLYADPIEAIAWAYERASMDRSRKPVIHLRGGCWRMEVVDQEGRISRFRSLTIRRLQALCEESRAYKPA